MEERGGGAGGGVRDRGRGGHGHGAGAGRGGASGVRDVLAGEGRRDIPRRGAGGVEAAGAAREAGGVEHRARHRGGQGDQEPLCLGDDIQQVQGPQDGGRRRERPGEGVDEARRAGRAHLRLRARDQPDRDRDIQVAHLAQDAQRHCLLAAPLRRRVLERRGARRRRRRARGGSARVLHLIPREADARPVAAPAASPGDQVRPRHRRPRRGRGLLRVGQARHRRRRRQRARARRRVGRPRHGLRLGRHVEDLRQRHDLRRRAGHRRRRRRLRRVLGEAPASRRLRAARGRRSQGRRHYHHRQAQGEPGDCRPVPGDHRLDGGRPLPRGQARARR
mmetsp:Transcript_19062/g.59905  ORF Transcript_19062/g.59905 Transcript_19062/m.59905 type:complete len:334 (-) Transcript_19062:1977-2978(-)